MSIEDIDNLMLDTQEAIAYQNQIEEALSGKLSDEDEESVLEELAALEKESGADITAEMPDVPSEELPEDEIRVEKPVKTKASKQEERVAQMA